MSTSQTLRSADGQTISGLANAMKARVPKASNECVKAIGVEARRRVADEGSRFYIRNRKRTPVRLGAKVSATTAGRSLVEGTPAGFWAIVNEGSKKHRIERKLKGRGKGRRAQLLRTPYGPRPYVLHPGHRALGHPWASAMSRVSRIPQNILDPSITDAFRELWR